MYQFGSTNYSLQLIMAGIDTYGKPHSLALIGILTNGN